MREETAPGTSRGAWLPLAALGAWAVLLGTIRIRSVDFFWHLAAGRWIRTHGEIPRNDPFRFTSDGAPWVDHEWLFQWLLAGVDALGGIPVLVAGRTLLAVGLALLLWWLARREGASPWIAAALAGLALAGIRPRLLLRPELVTFLGLVSLLLVLQRVRRGAGVGHAAAALGIVVVWVNGHPGALVAPVVVAMYLGGAALGAVLDGDRAGARALAFRGALLTPATALALLLNPYGVSVYGVPFAISSALADVAGTNPDWLPSWTTVRPLYFAALVGLALWTAAAWRRGKRPDTGSGAVVLAMAGLSVLQARQQPLFWIAGVALAGFLASRPVWSRAEIRFARIAVGLALVLVGAWILRPFGEWAGREPHPALGGGIEPGLYPEEAVTRLASEWSDVGNLYHDLPYGGYLLWRLHPPRQVFWDTRNEVDPQLLLTMGRARRDGRLWFEVLERFAIDGALVRYDEDLRPEVELAPDGPRVVGHHTTNALFFPPELFALVYWDDQGMLFVRRTPERAERLARHEYRAVHPEDWRAMLARAENDPTFRAEVERELRSRVAEAPRSERAERLFALVERMPLPAGSR